MSRGIIWSLLGLGFLLWSFGTALNSSGPANLGLLLLIAGIALLIYGLRPGGILRQEEVIDNWSVLIDHGEGHAEDVFTKTVERIEETNAPNVLVDRRSMAPSFTRGIRDIRRDFVEVTQRGNRHLDPFQMFVNARDYGTNLAVDWYLTYRPPLLQVILMLLFIRTTSTNILGELDLFDQQDLRAYVTNAHHCLLDSVDSVMESLNMDPSKIDRKSRGFLGIS